MLLIQLINIYTYIVLGAVIISWIQLPPDNPIVQVLHTLTEPVLGPIRRVMPDLGGIDISPIVLLVGLHILKGVLIQAL